MQIYTVCYTVYMDTAQRFEKPRYELADIIHLYGDDYRRTHVLSPLHHAVLNALGNCRTSVLGGHLEECDECGYQQPAYNSCRNRCCPKCQGMNNMRWVMERENELLPIQYFHVVFTLPHELNLLAQYNPKLIYTLLFRAAIETLQEFADKRWHGKLGISCVLHTWGQQLEQHIHLHCIVTGGVLTHASTKLSTGDGERWISAPKNYLFKVENLGTVYRGKFCEKLLAAFDDGELKNPPDSLLAASREHLQHLLDHLHGKPWVVYSKPPFAGPEAVLKYLSRYTHRIAIGNRRLQSIDNGEITFTWKDYKNDGMEKTMTLSADEFLRRFLLHVPPKGFVRVRHYGILAGRDRTAKLERCRELHGLPKRPPKKALSNLDLLREMTGEPFGPAQGRDPQCCPHCGKGRMVTVAEFPNRLPRNHGPPKLREAA